MKQYTFKDGIKVIASTKEEAKSKHKVMAANNDMKYAFKQKAENAFNEIFNSLKSANIKIRKRSYPDGLGCVTEIKTAFCSLELELFANYNENEILMNSDLTCEGSTAYTHELRFGWMRKRTFKLSQTKAAVDKFKECLELFKDFSKKYDEGHTYVKNFVKQVINKDFRKLNTALGEKL